jgi:hypothetical protein
VTLTSLPNFRFPLRQPDGEALLASAMLPEFADHADRIGQAGRLLIEKVDEHRRTLDRAYGRG